MFVGQYQTRTYRTNAFQIKKTNFKDDTDLKLLLESLLRTFMEFKYHEQIENQLIMKKLKNKLKQLSIQNAAVCNCHNVGYSLKQSLHFLLLSFNTFPVFVRINSSMKRNCSKYIYWLWWTKVTLFTFFSFCPSTLLLFLSEVILPWK